jgi:protein-S-isoprenylcysteine O-methyltransferase Ste14
MHRWIPPPVVALICAGFMWAVTRQTGGARAAFVWRQPLALMLLIAGLLLMAAAVAGFLHAKTTINPLRPDRAARLITGGVFRFSRNPIYLGDALVLAALAVWLGHAWNLVPVVLFVFYIDRLQIRAEEQALQQRFGSHYQAYCARVRRWL